MGRLTKKIQRQEKELRMRPPMAGPKTMPMVTMVPMMPRALPRSLLGKFSVTIAIPRPAVMAAPMA